MKLIKRLGLLFLVLCMSQTTFAAEQSEEASNPIDMTREETIVLKALDILDAEGKSADAPVTRTEFADAIVMTVNDKKPTGAQVYDLRVQDGGLYWLMSRGMLHGNGAGEFRPDDNITIAEAVKISLSVLGYDKQAALDGGYPMGYIAIANRLRLLGGVSGATEDELTYEGFISLLYNVTDCDIMELVLYSADEYSGFAIRENETLLSAYRGIYKAEDLVTADEATGLYSEGDRLERGEIKIGDKVFLADSTYSADVDMLGLNVVYYYRDEDPSDELICAVPVHNEVLKIRGIDILDYNGGEYTYTTDGEKKKTAVIDGSTIIIYNGVYMPENQVFKPEYGRVELVDNNGNGGWDILKIHDAELIITDRTMLADNKFSIFDKYDGKYHTAIDNYINAAYRVYDTAGIRRGAENINAGNVLEFEKSASQNPYYRITLSVNTVDSQITGMSSDKKHLTLANGEEYETTDRFIALVEAGELEVIYNKQSKLYLTSDNRVAYFDYGTVDGSPLSWRIGYLHRFAYEQQPLEQIPMARVLDQGGTWETYGFASSVKVDGEKVKKEDIDFSEKLGGLIKYMLNIHGEISDVYFPADIPDDPTSTEMDENFQLMFNGNGTRQYYPTGWTIARAGAYTAVPSTMPVFIKSDAESALDLTEDHIKVTGFTIMGDGYGTYSIQVYCTTGKPGSGDVALIASSDKSPTIDRRDNRPIVVNSIAEAVTEDGTPVYAVSGLQAGVEVTINVDDQRSDRSKMPFKKGDVIYLVPDIGGMVTLRDDVVSNGISQGYSYGVLCGYDENGVLKAYYSTSGDVRLQTGKWGLTFNHNDIGANNNRTMFAKVYDVEGNKVYVNDDNLDDWTKIEPLSIPSYEFVYVWDDKEEEFRLGTVAEAVGYKYDRANASDIYVVNTNSYVTAVIYP